MLEEQAVPLLLWVGIGPLYPSGSAASLYLVVRLLLDFVKLIKSHRVPARRVCTFITALPWGHVIAPVEFVILKC